MRARLGVGELAPDRITVPLYAGVWRAPLGGSDLMLVRRRAVADPPPGWAVFAARRADRFRRIPRRAS